MADIEEKIVEDLEDFKDLEEEVDVYSDEGVDDLVENGEMSNEEAAFMKGYNKAEI